MKVANKNEVGVHHKMVIPNCATNYYLILIITNYYLEFELHIQGGRKMILGGGHHLS